MEKLEKKEYLNQLYDLYGNLLTDKQKLYFEHYFQEDYSLQEIAELYQISRNAVFDHLKKVEEHLSGFEQKLNLLEKKNKRHDLMDQMEKDNHLELLNTLRKLDE